MMPCRLTPKIMPGVVNIPQGAWWTPDKKGIDRRGNINVLTSHRWTPLAFGNAQHTIMVEVEGRTENGKRRTENGKFEARISKHEPSRKRAQRS